MLGILKRYKYGVLLLLIWLGMIVDPVLSGWAYHKVLFSVFQTGIVLFGLWALQWHRIRWFLAVGFGGLAVLSSWYIRFSPASPALALVNDICYTIFFGVVFIHIVQRLFEIREVASRHIIVAVVGYLLLGLLGAGLATMIELITPGSYQYQQTSLPLDFNQFTYYSFVTLTTLGYGDLTPLTPLAKALASTLSLLGQVYLTIVVAMLVGKYVKYND
jgi:voltage-gated potassium channel